MFNELVGGPGLRLEMSFMPGDVQFLHNHTILHARSAYDDWPEVEHKRHLLRLRLSPQGARLVCSSESPFTIELAAPTRRRCRLAP
jgi:hypothetical protein